MASVMEFSITLEFSRQCFAKAKSLHFKRLGDMICRSTCDQSPSSCCLESLAIFRGSPAEIYKWPQTFLALHNQTQCFCSVLIRMMLYHDCLAGSDDDLLSQTITHYLPIRTKGAHLFVSIYHCTHTMVLVRP